MSTPVTLAEAEQVAKHLVNFGNYRVLRSQQLAEPTFVPPSVLMALGLRETDLTNICGGAQLVDGRWVQAFRDRGCFQIVDTIPENLAWLATEPGCPNGQWSPASGQTAAAPMHCPQFTPAAEFVLHEFEANREQALAAKVPESHVLQFCVAAHNAGFEGALEGFHEDDMDAHTAHGDYSAWVLRFAPVIHDWVVEHRGWIYTGQSLGDVAPGE